MRSSRRRQRGQALIVLALAGLAISASAPTPSTRGMSMADRHSLQATADSAALAGARSLTSGAGTANCVAMQYLADNLAFTVPATCNGASCPAGSDTRRAAATPSR